MTSIVETPHDPEAVTQMASTEIATNDANDRKVESVHFGDAEFDDQEPQDIPDATWKEVCVTCCVHTPREWGMLLLAMIGVLFFLYWFIFALELLGTGAKVLTGCAAGALFGDNMNPIAALMVGILCTVLLQSSSTTTSIIVSLVGSGAIDVEPAIYMVMGANIGTSVTNTIVAMGQMGDGAQLERAFAGATVHDMFNYLAVIVLLPVEAATGYLAALSRACTKNWTPYSGSGSKSKGIKTIIAPILDLLIKSNKKVIDDIATGAASSCAEYYPVYCVDGIETYQNCVKEGRIGLITCSKDTNKCPAFFQNGASEADDKLAGGVSLVLGIVFLVICLMGLVSILQRILLGASTRIIYKATNVNGYIAMLIGAGITVLVQSSSVTTSVLTPLVGLGVIQLEQMYPLTLGANLGTTVTALMAAGVADEVAALQVALAHFFFNATGIIIWYPIPFMRRVPMRMARLLGKATKWWRGFPLLYIAVMFFAIPLILLGISTLFYQGSVGYVALGALLCIGLGFALVYFLYWWFRKDGKKKTIVCMKSRQVKHETIRNLPEDMKRLKECNEFLEREVARLKEHTLLPDIDEVGEIEKIADVQREKTVDLDADDETSDEGATLTV